MRARLVPLLLLPCLPLLAQESPDRAVRFLDKEREAFVHYRRQDWDKAIAVFEEQTAIFAGNPRPYYNIACCHALKGDAERAATWLRLAITHGWRDADHLAADGDFDAVRDSEAFRRCREELEEVRRRDPDPLPRILALESAPPGPSARALLARSDLELRLLAPMRDLLEEHQFRKELFAAFDRRIAMLGRYLAENGDARDAAEAALGRVATAFAYWERADEDRPADARLREVAGRLVLATAEEFLRGYAGSPFLPDVRMLRAEVLTEPQEKERALRSLVADHPRSDVAPQAQVELCALLADAGRLGELHTEWKRLCDRWGRIPHPRLLAARLLAEGLPDLAKLAPGTTLLPLAFQGTALYLFVSVDSVDSESLLAELHRLVPREEATVCPVVFCLDGPERVEDADVERWLSEHAAGYRVVPRAQDAIELLWLGEVPTLIVARADGEVLAVDPDMERLAVLLGKR